MVTSVARDFYAVGAGHRAKTAKLSNAVASRGLNNAVDFVDDVDEELQGELGLFY